MAPAAEWPGVTTEIPAVWVAACRRWESPDGKYFFDREAAGATPWPHHDTGLLFREAI